MSGVWWKVAWRNLWRHTRRTLITATALAFGFLASVLIVGISQGIVEEMVENGTRVFTGQIQVQSETYQPDRSLYETPGGADGVDLPALLETLDGVPEVMAAAPRVYGGGLVSAGEETIAGFVVGIDPERERQVTRILESVTEGRLPRPGERELLLGAEAARQLKVGVGAELVLVAPAADGSLGNDLFTVSGLFRSGMQAFDANYVLLPLDQLQLLLALDPGRIHEVVIRVEGAWAAPEAAPAVTAALGDRWGQLRVEPWTEFRPELREYAQLAESGNIVIVVIVFGMAVFGVANTMLMATMERRREFAVIRALGTTPGQVAGTVIREGLVLGLLSLAAGLVLAIPLMFWWAANPPDLGHLFGDFTMAGSLVRPVLRVKAGWDGPLISGIALLLTALLASLYPALRAVRIPPADALADR